MAPDLSVVPPRGCTRPETPIWGRLAFARQPQIGVSPRPGSTATDDRALEDILRSGHGRRSPAYLRSENTSDWSLRRPWRGHSSTFPDLGMGGDRPAPPDRRMPATSRWGDGGVGDSSPFSDLGMAAIARLPQIGEYLRPHSAATGASALGPLFRIFPVRRICPHIGESLRLDYSTTQASALEYYWSILAPRGSLPTRPRAIEVLLPIWTKMGASARPGIDYSPTSGFPPDQASRRPWCGHRDGCVQKNCPETVSIVTWS